MFHMYTFKYFDCSLFFNEEIIITQSNNSLPNFSEKGEGATKI